MQPFPQSGVRTREQLTPPPAPSRAQPVPFRARAKVIQIQRNPANRFGSPVVTPACVSCLFLRGRTGISKYPAFFFFFFYFGSLIGAEPRGGRTAASVQTSRHRGTLPRLPDRCLVGDRLVLALHDQLSPVAPGLWPALVPSVPPQIAPH